MSERHDDAGIRRVVAGLHEPDTVHIITIISGEIHAILEESEVLLKPGDTFGQRATKHIGSNRGDAPCTLVSATAGALR